MRTLNLALPLPFNNPAPLKTEVESSTSLNL